jgi:translation initiation factor 3 subunit D
MTMGGRGGARGGMVGGWQERNRDGQTNAAKQYARDQRDAKDRARFGGGRGGGGRGGGRGFDSWRDRPQRIRVASVEIRSEWTPLDGTAGLDDFTMSLTSMDKLSAKEEPQAEEVAAVGSTFLSDKGVDRASVRAPVQLRKLQEPKPFHLATTDDPVIRKLAAQGRANIFATDIALAVLMAAPRSAAMRASGTRRRIDDKSSCKFACACR